MEDIGPSFVTFGLLEHAPFSQVFLLISLLIEAGCLEHVDLINTKFQERKRRAGIALTEKGYSILRNPIDVYVTAIRQRPDICCNNSVFHVDIVKCG